MACDKTNNLTSKISESNSANNQCLGVIKMSQETTKNISDKVESQQQINEFCRDTVNFKSQTLSVDAKAEYKYVGGKISADGSYSNEDVKETRDKYCGGSDGTTSKAHSYETFLQTVNINAYNSYNQCLKMSTEGLKIKVESITQPKFIMSLHFNTTSQQANVATFNVDTNSGSGEDVSCLWKNSSFDSISMNNGTSGLLSCTRPNDASYSASVTIVRTDSSKLDETITLHWEPIDKHGVPLSQITVNKNNIDTNTNKIGTNANNIGTNTNKIDILSKIANVRWKMGNNGTVSCRTFCGRKDYEGFTAMCISGYYNQSPQTCDFVSPTSQALPCLCVELP